MRFGNNRSSNVVDARGSGGGGGRGVGIGLGGLVVLLVGAYFGIDTSGLVGGGSAPAPTQQQARPADMSDAQNAFLGDVLGDTEIVWGNLFQKGGIDYPEPTVVRFNQPIRTGCGTADSRMGPFYCPVDQKLYIDTSFFDELAGMGAPGQFASAYVLAHEVGHHIQNLEGTLEKVQGEKRRLSEVQANQLSVATELQADCYAGIWAHFAKTNRNVIQDSEVQQGLNAAAAVGDDRLQRQAGMQVNPESFSHGSSAQRVEWFRRGFSSGDLGQCDTFAQM